MDPIQIDWKLDLFPQGVFERRLSLLEQPVAVAPGDGVRLQLSLSAPRYVYVFWTDSDGAWKQLFPGDGQPPQRVQKLELPVVGNSMLPLSGAPQWDACIAVVRQAPAPDDMDWRTLLRPNASLDLPESTMLVDDRSLPIASLAPIGSVENSAAARLEKPARAVGEPEAIVFESAMAGWKQWRGSVPATVGQISYVTLLRAP